MVLVFNGTQGMNARIYKGYIVSRIFGNPKSLPEPVIPFTDFIREDRKFTPDSSCPFAKWDHPGCYWIVLE